MYYYERYMVATRYASLIHFHPRFTRTYLHISVKREILSFLFFSETCVTAKEILEIKIYYPKILSFNFFNPSREFHI